MQEQDQRKTDHITGHDIPSGDGSVGDEQIKAIDKEASGEGGQDHSTEGHERAEPTGGVGAVQDSSDTGSDVADISD